MVRSRTCTLQLGLAFLCSLNLLGTGNATDDIQGCQCAAGQLGLVWMGASTQQSPKPISVLVFALVCVSQHVIALGSLGIPLKSVMSAVGQYVCAAGQGEKMGEELMICPFLMLLSLFITAIGSLHFFL